MPLGPDGELLEEEPMWKQCSHPVFNADVFSSEYFAVLEAMVNESQKKAEGIRREPPVPLTSQEFRVTAAALETNIINAIKNIATTDAPSDAAIQDAAASAVREVVGTAIATDAGADAPTAATAATAAIAATAATTATIATTTAAAAATATAGAAPATDATCAAARTRKGTERQIKPKKNRQVQSAEHYCKVYGRKGAFYCQNENLMTIREIWTEYEYGWNHGPALKHLNQQQKQWNKYGAAKVLYSKRKAIYDTILKLMSRNGRTEDEAIAELQLELDAFPKSQHRKKPSLEAFNKMLRDRMKYEAEANARADADADADADAEAEAAAEAEARAAGALVDGATIREDV